MPVAVSYPGVYIEELPSGVRTITGVATSITAFLGRTANGPVNDPTLCNSFGDFERRFGGLAGDRPLSYAVRDFFANGGGQALIVRLAPIPNLNNASPPPDGRSRGAVGELKFMAADAGIWGDKLKVAVDFKDIPQEVIDNLGAPVFNLSVKLGQAEERFLNLSLKDNARRIDRVLKAGSSWVRWDEKEDIPTSLAKTTEIDKARTDLKTAQSQLTQDQGAQPPVPATIDAAKKDVEAKQKTLDTALGPVEGTFKDGAKEGALNETAWKAGLNALDKADLFNLLCIPPDVSGEDVLTSVWQAAATYCERRRAMLLVDAPFTWSANADSAAADAVKGLPDIGIGGTSARHAALYFPSLLAPDPLRGGSIEEFVPCGAVAGIMARTDSQRGVWKAPAGLDAAVNGIAGFKVNLTDAENGQLNPLGINCLRSFPVNGRVVWGARTLRGADQLADEWKYVPVRRTALFIEESLYRGTQWVVFEPNDEPLWSQIRLNVGAFMNGLFRQGAFQGKTPAEAYFVRCDKDTNPQNDIDRGIVNILVGFAPLKPAEFVIIKLQQIAGQLQV